MRRLPILLAGLLLTLPARADITIGAVLSLTGPAASLGIPARNTLDLAPKQIAGQPVRLIVLDDGSDSTGAVRAARKLVDEEKVDALIGPSVTPTSLAVLDVAGSSGTPMVSLAGSGSIITPQEGARRWAFKMVPNEQVATNQNAADMKKHGVKTLAHIGFANAFGDAFIAAQEASAKAAGIENLMQVRYNLADTSVTPQVLRLMQAKPDAVFVAGSGTPGVTPILELRNRGYTGRIYTNQGVSNADVLRVGGRALEGMVFGAVPVLVAEQLDDKNPVKAPALAYVHAYEAKYGPGSRSLFGAMAWDAFNLIAKAAPTALKAAKPGTPEFRLALRDAMERVTGMPGAQAMFNLSPTDHSGGDPASQVLVTVKDGKWTYLRE